MRDERRNSGEYYPGGRVIARPGTAPQQVVVQWSDVQGKPQIAPLPDRYRESDMKGKINEIASKFATVLMAAFVVWTACADVTVQKKRKDEIYNDELVVVDVTGGGTDTNAVIDIANATIATNPVVVGKLDKTDGIGSISWNNGSLDANAATVSCGGGFTTPYDFQIKESPSAQPTHALSAKANRAESGNADEIATLDADGNPTRSGIAKTSVATKDDLDDYLPLTGGELSGGLYALYSIASATIIGAPTIDATASIRLGSENYYLHNEDECLADNNGKFAHETMISATDPTFSNAVLAVGLNIDTNAVAVLNDIAATFGGFPRGAGETATTVGGLLAALAAAIAWLKKNKVGSFASVGGATATVENGVAKLEDFFTNSNSLLTGFIESKMRGKADQSDLDALAAKVDIANAALEEVA